ncbi:hypothetical protein GN958_ATG22627 [Phytophthora infestans]|uniref:Uncharacterized protein n=1 Tax=Phytophthora infestans TaxID=4787 RepID=A0A8S9TMW1_PHYIN|nr:hypothetical protein GN958_ATG22627 [Phytophthora infestans]
MDPGIVTDPCTVCGKGVHHICANEVYTGELSTRLCSRSAEILLQQGQLALQLSSKAATIPRTETNPKER